MQIASTTISLMLYTSLNAIKDIETMDMSAHMQTKKSNFVSRYTFEDIICIDPKIHAQVRMAKRYAEVDGALIIMGESWTGKELFAGAVHNASIRRDGLFVAINCATLNESLVESELFGYEKGSFTGVLTSGKMGLFEIAHKGTLFLDEIAELPLPMRQNF